jgi:streptogramin lyase
MPGDGSMLAYYPDGVYRSASGPGPDRLRFRKVLDQPGVDGGELQPDGRVLINSRTRGMQLFDPDNGALASPSLQNGGLPNLGYYSDAHGGLWVGTGESVQLLDRQGKVVRQFVTSGGFTAATFSANLTDREGNVWFVTPEGSTGCARPGWRWPRCRPASPAPWA